METFLDGLGLAALVILAFVGLVVGLLAAVVSGRSKVLYAVVGALAAMATPFLLAALGVTVLAAGGIVLILVTGAVGAALVIGLLRMLTRRD